MQISREFSRLICILGIDHLLFFSLIFIHGMFDIVMVDMKQLMIIESYLF